MGNPGSRHDLIGPALVRLSRGAECVGAGFLVSPDRIATCAHVVADVLGVPAEQAERPTASFVVEFPLLRDTAGTVLATRVEVADWQPIAADGTGDVAILRLLDQAPPGALPAPALVRDDVWKHPFRAIGFPDGHDDGTWVAGRLLARQGTGWIQLSTESGQRGIERGFSGAPVWDDELGGVVGIVVTRALDDSTTAFLLPTTSLGKAWNTGGTNPYLGLKAFEEGDARYFHGRDEEVEQLAEQVNTQDLVAVAGPSGSGKSSLVRAGLVPRLRAEGVDFVELRPDPEDLGPVHGRLGVPERPTVLFLDQFEELVVADPAAARGVVERITSVTAEQRRSSDAPPPLRVVLTLRSRSLDDLVTPETARNLKQAVHFVSPMSEQQLAAAIVGPAREVGGLAFEDALVERLLADTRDQPGVLPLVSLALSRLWADRHGGWLTHQAYEDLGRVPGALGHEAEKVYGSLSAAGQQQARRLLTQLTRPDGEGGFARRSLRTADLGPDLGPAVAVLAPERLVVVEHTEDGGERVDLVHQALIDWWERLRGWLRDDEDFLAWQADLRQDMQQWEQADRDPDSLLRGAALNAAVHWAAERGESLTPAQHGFVRRSEQAERSRARRWRVVTAVSVVLALLASVLAGVALQQSSVANTRLHEANSNLLARQVERLEHANDYEGALQLALASWKESPDTVAGYGAVLNQYLRWRQTERIYPKPYGAEIHHTSLSADGRTLVTVNDSTPIPVQIWTGFDAPEPTITELPIRNALNASISPDAATIATVNEFGAVELWNTRTRERIAEVRRPLSAIPVDFKVQLPRLNFSGDGRYLTVVPGNIGSDRPEDTWIESFDTRTLSSTSERPEPGDTGLPVSNLVPTRDPAVRLAEIEDRIVEVSSRDEPGHDYGRARILPGGDEVMRCLGDGESVEIVDRATKAVRAAFPRAGCYAQRIGDYLTWNDSTLTEAGQVLHVTHIPSGREYEFLGESSSFTFSQVLAIAPGPDGSLDAVVNSFKTVRRLPLVERTGRPQGDWGDIDRSVTTGYDENNTVAAVTTTNEVVLLDETFTRLRARMPKPDENVSLAFDRDGKRLYVTTPQKLLVHRLPDLHLEREVEVPQPDYPAVEHEQESYSTVAYLSPTEIAVLHAGMLTRWDSRTWQQLSEPLVLGADDAETAALIREGSVMARERHPGQVVVAAGDRISLWDLVQRRKVRDYPANTESGVRQHILSEDGKTYVYQGIWGEEERGLLDLDTGQEVTGLTPDGFMGGDPLFVNRDRMIAADEGVFEVWDWPNRVLITEIADAPPVSNWLSSENLIIGLRPGRAPVRIPLQARAMADALCALQNRGFTPDEEAALPPGASHDPPCS